MLTAILIIEITLKDLPEKGNRKKKLPRNLEKQPKMRTNNKNRRNKREIKENIKIR